MSWEVWGTPPDVEPGPEPEQDWMVPHISERQQWCCARGCGPCEVKTIAHVWREVHDRNGKLLEQNTTPTDVSSCCGADLMLWDNDTQDFVEWAPVARPPANTGGNRMSQCVLIPPTEEIGARIVDPDMLAAVLATKGRPAEVTALARRLGADMGMPNADHFHVPVRPGTSCAPLMEGGQMVCFLAAWEKPNAASGLQA